MTSKSIRLFQGRLVLPVVLAGTALSLVSASAAFAQQGMPLINPPGMGSQARPGLGGPSPSGPGAQPGPSPIRSVTGPSSGPGPAYQGSPRSLLPPAEPSEYNSFNPAPQARQEASADPDAAPSVMTSNPPTTSPAPVAIPVQDSGDSAGPAPAQSASGQPGVAEVQAVRRPRGHSELVVTMDQAVVVRAPNNVRTMILGNPVIADVATQRGGLIVVTGKMYGSTNLVLVDAKGVVIGESMIKVQPPKVDVVTVQLGMQRQSYSCTPMCQPTVVVGNDQSWFSSVQGQAQQRSQGMKQAQ